MTRLVIINRSRQFAKSIQSGFTLIELVVTLAIAAILLTQAVPSFMIFIKNNRLTTNANDFVIAVNYARSEAIKRGTAISLVAVGGGNDNEWGNGWKVITGTVVAAGDANVLRQSPAFTGSAKLDSTNGISTFTYASSGRVNAPDSLDLCDDRTAETGRTITISTTGRASTTNLACS